VEQRKKPPGQSAQKETITKQKETKHNKFENKRNSSKIGKSTEKTIDCKTKIQITSEAASTRETRQESQTDAASNSIRQDGKNEPKTTSDTANYSETGNFNPSQSKYQPVFRGRMRPDPSIRHHPAYPMLFEYATNGCPVDCGESWNMEHLEAAIHRGPHISAKSPEAAACLRQEALEKVAQGEAEVIKWDDIKDSPHPNLKISPLAAVPHKSRLFWAILDLSFQLRLRGIKCPSVNAETIPLSDHKAMEQMGKVLWRLVSTVASTKNNHNPIVFAKWDIKDGFWRLVVSEEDSWNFCYVLPRMNDDDPIEIVRPTCLQMGWCESPPLFCTASETARDIAQEKSDAATPLDPHPLEHHCLPDDFHLPQTECIDSDSLTKLLEVYMDDFMGLAQALSRNELLHFTRAVLHGIHTVFPPPGPTEDQTDEPISIKKLKQGDGLWDTQKELLGWLFDGVTKCMSLPADKVQKIRKSLLQTA